MELFLQVGTSRRGEFRIFPKILGEVFDKTVKKQNSLTIFAIPPSWVFEKVYVDLLYILRSNFGSSFRTPWTFLVFHLALVFCAIKIDIWLDMLAVQSCHLPFLYSFVRINMHLNNLFFKHICYSNVANFKVVKLMKRSEIVIHKYIITNSWT